MKIGRNDPCFCGSGNKYKKCCIDKEVAFTDSVKFTKLYKEDPTFTPRSYYLNRITTLNDRLQQEARSEALDAELMELAGDILDDLEYARLHAFTRYGEGFLPTERRLLQELANRIWGGLVLGGFQEQEVLRPLLDFAVQVLVEGIREESQFVRAVLTTDEDGNLLYWTFGSDAVDEGAIAGAEQEGFVLTFNIHQELK